MSLLITAVFNWLLDEQDARDKLAQPIRQRIGWQGAPAMGSSDSHIREPAREDVGQRALPDVGRSRPNWRTSDNSA
jgi:hypothetical protein